MGSKGKSDKKKNKGPKGKKARAKAKLERQWGEHVDEDEQNQGRIRRGKSRLLVPNTAKQSSTYGSWGARESIHHEASRVEETDGDDSETTDDEGHGNDAALDLLMANIYKSKKTRKSLTSEAGSDSDMEAEDHMSEDEIQLNEHGSDHETMEVEEYVAFGSDDAHAAGGKQDPFSNHFNYQLPENNEHDLSCIKTSVEMRKSSTPFLDRFLELQLPSAIVEQQAGTADSMDVSEATRRLSFNRKVLEEGWRTMNRPILRQDSERAAEGGGPPGELSALQDVLYPSLVDYRDLLVTAVSREKNRDALNNILYLHVVNHVLTSRGRIQRNNKRVKEIEELENEPDVDADKFRDQGYTRPTVLILLPTRGTCQSFVHGIMKVLGDSVYVENLDRFDTEYGLLLPAEDDEETDEARKRRRKAILESKGAEWQELFGDEANDDDDFKVGMSMTPKAAAKKKNPKSSKTGGVSVKLYSDFYRSDIIVASPLGLKMAIESGDGEGGADYLSSIEVCVVAHSEVLLMQNWDHVNSVLDLLNKQPTKNNDTDFSRVRHYLLNGKAEYWRQLIVCSQLTDPSVLSTFKRFSRSIEGRAKLKRRTPVEDSSLCSVTARVKQVFHRITSNSLASQGNDRLRYFADRVLPRIRQSKQKHTMIFIPSYFDFIAVRNALLKKEMDFVSVTEYARVSEVSRGRARFLQGRKPIMLYTGRCHFFSRHTIKGVRHLIWFGLPEQPDVFSGMINSLNLGLDGVEMDAPTTCLALFTKYDAHALERIVGSSHCERMIKGDKATFMFAS